MKHNAVRVDNLKYRGCEPHWRCTQCGKCVPFHCYTKEQFENEECENSDAAHIMEDLNNWEQVTTGLYRYVVAANACYELHILHWDFATDILTAKASVFLVGDWRQSNGNSFFERETILAEKPVFACLEAAQKDNNNGQ